MAKGLSSTSTKPLILQNFFLAIILTLLIYKFYDRHAIPTTINYSSSAFLVILFKEIVEIFVEPGSAAISDVIAGGVGATLGHLLLWFYETYYCEKEEKTSRQGIIECDGEPMVDKRNDRQNRKKKKP